MLASINISCILEMKYRSKVKRCPLFWRPISLKNVPLDQMWQSAVISQKEAHRSRGLLFRKYPPSLHVFCPEYLSVVEQAGKDNVR